MELSYIINLTTYEENKNRDYSKSNVDTLLNNILWGDVKMINNKSEGFNFEANLLGFSVFAYDALVKLDNGHDRQVEEVKEYIYQSYHLSLKNEEKKVKITLNHKDSFAFRRKTLKNKMYAMKQKLLKDLKNLFPHHKDFLRGNKLINMIEEK